MEILEFLSLVLPEEGLRCAFSFADFSVYKFLTNEKLAEYLLWEDQQGRPAQPAFASYIPGPTKKREDVYKVKDLWIDVDFKTFDLDEGKARHAVEEFISANSLPRPLIIRSGGGYHCHWPLREPLERDGWEPYALGLSERAYDAGFDAQVTRDCQRLIRPPGSRNFNYNPPRVVGLLERGDGPYDIEMFRDFARPVSQPLPIRKIERDGTREPTYGGAIPERCAQLRYLRDTGCAGHGHEFTWKLCLGVLAFADDGDGLAHEWSSRDPRYSRDEVDYQLSRFRANSGPPSCAAFRARGTFCDGCTEAVHTPLHLGRRPYIQHEADDIPHIRDDRVHDRDWPGSFVPNNAIDPKGFFRKSGALYFEQVDFNTGEHTDILLTKDDVRYVTLSLDPSGDHFDCFELKKPDGSMLAFMIPMGLTNSAAGLVQLGRKGLNLRPGEAIKHFFEWVILSRELVRADKMEDGVYSQWGWCDGGTAFVVGTDKYSSQGWAQIRVSNELRGRLGHLQPKGSLAGWQVAARQLLALGSEMQGFCLLASFASPLMHLLSPTEGGAVIALTSRASGQGKTTALDMAASVWGDKRGLETAVQDTSNSRVNTWGLLGNLPCVCDEFTQVDPKVVLDQLAAFNLGLPKGRLGQNGEAIQKDLPWQMIFITAANTSLNDMVMGQGKSLAQAARVIEINLRGNIEVDHVKGDELRRQLAANCGHAGRTFMGLLLSDAGMLDWLKEELGRQQSFLNEKYGLRATEMRFVSRALTCIRVAGTILDSSGLLECSVDRLLDWAMEHVRAQVAEHKAAIQEITDPISALSLFLVEMQPHTLIASRPPVQGSKSPIAVLDPRPRGEVYVRKNDKAVEGGARTTVIARGKLSDWLTARGLKVSHFLQDLEKIGVLVPGCGRKNLGAGTEWAAGMINAVEVYSKYLDGEGD